MKTSRVSTLRREQIVDAAVAVIDEQGIQHLSLSEIEKKTGLARGQLMYYFHSKEDILLAVFDRLLQLMHERVHAGNGHRSRCPAQGGEGWQAFRGFLEFVLLQPPVIPAFHSLQYTFLSQTSHREDFRQKLADLFATWRGHMAEHFAQDMALKASAPNVSPHAFATLVQAILHGLAMQRVADPDAFDPHEMLNLVLELFSPYLNPAPAAPKNKRTKPAATNGKVGKHSRPRGRRPAHAKKVNRVQD